MPTYVYTCDSCSHEFEREQRITEKPIKKCPRCGKLKARRMIGGGGFILKGGGWESDLYSGPSNRSQSDTKPKADAKAKGEAKPKAGDSAASGGSSTPSGSASKADA
ncbi:MAG: zinc ribbon domain-containing protein [Myxococcales bacterium]|jgi:putative FmdB family regulatory protein